MKYVGSKNRYMKELAPIIQSYITPDTKGYLELFVGGANSICKINHPNRIGWDIHTPLVALLQKVQEDISDVPDRISEEEYIRVKDNKENYLDWYLGLVGFCATFSAKYFGGYARGKGRDIPEEAIRNLKRQATNLKDIQFSNLDFFNIDTSKFSNYVIYCDPPYKGTLKYSTKAFDYERLYLLCNELAKNNIVLISEYNCELENAKCIWQKGSKVTISSTRGNNNLMNNRVEKLFIIES